MESFNRFTYKHCSPNIPEIHKMSLFPVKVLLYSILFLSVHSLHPSGPEFCLSKDGRRLYLQSSEVGSCSRVRTLLFECLINSKWKKALCKAKTMAFSWDTSANTPYGPDAQGCHQKPLWSFLCQYFSIEALVCIAVPKARCTFSMYHCNFTAGEWMMMVHCKLKTGI